MNPKSRLRIARTILPVLIPLVAIFAQGLALAGKAAAAEDDNFSKQTLRGLKGLYLMIEDVDPDLAKAGLTRDRIADEAEKRLRQIPLRTMSIKESFQEQGRPFLEIAIRLAKPPSGQYGYFIEVGLSQEIRPTRSSAGGGQPLHAQTWRIHETGAVERDKMSSLAAVVGTMVDRFVDAYQSVNKDLRTGQPY